MALPVTITGLSTAVGIVGPFKASSKVIASTTMTLVTGAVTTGTTAARRCAQVFVTAADTTSIVAVNVHVIKFGAPTDNIKCFIYACSGGNPTGTALYTSTNSFAGTALLTTYDIPPHVFTFSGATVAPSTSYAIVFERDGALDSVNYYALGRTTTLNEYPAGGVFNYTGSSWNPYSTDYDFNFQIIAEPGNYYFFGRDGTTATTLQAFKSTAPDTSWASSATKTGFTTAILKLDAYQVGSVIHLLVQDGTAPTALATKYVNYDAPTDTFLATTETVSAAVAVTGQVAGVGAGASLVVRSNGEVVAFYNGLQVKISNTFRAHVYYRRRTGVNTWTAETVINAATAFDNVAPIAVLGAAGRVHFVWASPNVNNRTLSAANALNTGTTSASLVSPGDAVSYDRSGTTKVVVTSNATGQTVQRFDSSDNPTASYATPTAANATLPHRIGANTATDDVTIVYRNSADSDLYAITSTDDGATFGTAVSFFVGTVASADANVSRSSSGSMYARGSNTVIGYVVNDNGTLKYNEYTLAAAGVTGTMAAPETADTATNGFSGLVGLIGTLAKTETADVGSFTGTVADAAVTGTLATIEPADVASAIGKVEWLATLAATEAADVANVTASVAWLATLATTEAADVANATGSVAWQAVLAATEAADVASIAAKVEWFGTLAATEAADVLAGTGLVLNVLTGTLVTTEAPDTSDMTGAVVSGLGGTLLATEAPDTAVFTGLVAGVAVTGLNVWTGTTWAEKPVKVWTGSAWVPKQTKYWTGSEWKAVA